MNKKLLFGLVPILALASCSFGDNTLFNKTFAYKKNGIVYNLETTYEGDTETLASLLKKHVADSTIDFTESGFCDTSGYVTSPFTATTSYSALISEMENAAKALFNAAYDGFSITIGKYVNGQADGVIKEKGKDDRNVIAKPGTEGDVESFYVELYDVDDQSSSICTVDGVTVVGKGVHNGKWDAVGVSYRGSKSSTLCCFKFNGVEQKYPVKIFAKICN